MSLFTVYTDVEDVITNGMLSSDTASLIGGHSQLATAAAAGAVSLNVFSSSTFTAGAGAQNATFQAWILDGPNSEIVTATVTDTTHLAVPNGTLAAHSANVSVSAAGTSGCLASVIRSASALIEQICMQGPDGGDRSLYAVSRSETLSGPSGFRATFDPEYTLLLKPYHFPIQSVQSVQIQLGAQTASAVDLTYQVLPDAARIVRIPRAQLTGSYPGGAGVPYLGSYWPRDVNFWATLTYAGGPIPGSSLDSVPSTIREASYLLIMDRLSFRQNPYGAAMVKRGDFLIETRLRGDTSGKSLLRIQAESYLYNYMAD